MKTNIKRDVNTFDLTFTYVDDNEEQKETTIVLNKPSWDITVEAFKYINDVNGNLDLITPGKLIFDLCALEYDDALLSNHQLLMSICSTLSTKFTLPINAEIKAKKKDID